MSRINYSFTTSFQPGANHATLSDLIVVKPGSLPITIDHVYLAGQQAGAGTPLFRLIRRSTDNTGGTRAALTPSKWDTSRPASDCVAYQYTEHPTAVGAQTEAFRTTPFQFDVGGLHAGINEWNFAQEQAIGIVVQVG